MPTGWSAVSPKGNYGQRAHVRKEEPDSPEKLKQGQGNWRTLGTLCGQMHTLTPFLLLGQNTLKKKLKGKRVCFAHNSWLQSISAQTEADREELDKTGHTIPTVQRGNSAQLPLSFSFLPCTQPKKMVPPTLRGVFPTSSIDTPLDQLLWAILIIL